MDVCVSYTAGGVRAPNLMSTNTHTFRLRPLIVSLAIVASGVALSYACIGPAAGIVSKLRGNAPDCSWYRAASFAHDNARLGNLLRYYSATTTEKRHDDRLDADLVASPRGQFWLKHAGETRPGKQLLSYLLAEHAWIAESNSGQMVRRGDTVLDCGAHVGVFTAKALELGARKVVAIEPEPTNLECLRRNFAKEILDGRVVVAGIGVWSKEGTMQLSIAAKNSGMNSMVERTGDRTVEVAVTTIDRLVESLRLERVDFIKMDIEGAEREALIGAQSTLKRFRPRLMLDAYHRPDDMAVIPAILRRAHSSYHVHCGPCESRDGKQLIPHVLFCE